MSKFKGIVCYAVNKETSPGVWKIADKVLRTYYGEWIRNVSKYTPSSGLVDDLSLANTLSILADDFAMDNYGRILYVEYRGSKWKVISVEEKLPRLLLTIGGVYSGK